MQHNINHSSYSNHWAHKLNRELASTYSEYIQMADVALDERLTMACNFPTADQRQEAWEAALDQWQFDCDWAQRMSELETATHLLADARCSALSIAADNEALRVAVRNAAHDTAKFLLLYVACSGALGLGYALGCAWRTLGFRFLGL